MKKDTLISLLHFALCAAVLLGCYLIYPSERVAAVLLLPVLVGGKLLRVWIERKKNKTGE